MAKDKDKDGKKETKTLDSRDPAKNTTPPKGFVNIAKTTLGEFMTDNCLNLSAAIAYYALQSIIPLILGFIALGSFFLQDNGTRQDFINGVKGAIPEEIGKATNFNDIIDGLIKGAGTAGILSVLTLLWTGSGIFDQFIFAINQAFDVEKDNRNFFVKIFLRMAMLVGLGALLALAFTITIIINVVFTAKLNIFGISLEGLGFLVPIFGYLLPMVIEGAIFALLYKFSPARKGVHWKPVLIGAGIAAVLFEVLKVGFTFYISIFGAASSAAKTYGAIGGIIVFLFFIYLSAAVVLLGAEVASVLHNFKSGLSAVKTGVAVVETPGQETESGALIPAFNSARSGSMAGRTPLEEFDYGLPEQARGKHKKYAPGTANSFEPAKNNPVAIVTGTVVLVVAALISALFRRKSAV